MVSCKQILLLITFTIVTSSLRSVQASRSSTASDDEPDPNIPYFYLGNPKAAPIREFANFGNTANERPKYIYDPPQNTYRLVEFYAHWCPHCQKFRTHYMAIAKKLDELAKKHNINLRIYGISCVPHKTLCRSQNVTGYPRVKLFAPESSDGKLINYWELHPFTILRMMGVNLDDQMEHEISDQMMEEEVEQQKIQQQQQEHGDENKPAEHYLPRTKADIYNDAYLSFDFAMRNGIFTNPGPLTNRTKDVFRLWIDQLQTSLPPTWGLQNLISEVRDNFDHAVESEANLLSIVDKYPPRKKQWSKSCSRGDPYSGYTCGLWELFHILSVGLVEFNQNIVGDDDWMFFRTEEFANNMRNYIELFFGCEVCRIHFIDAFDACLFDRCNRLVDRVADVPEWREFPLWLFETHNAVNARLLKEKAEQERRRVTREEEIGILWPPRKECPSCWHGDGRFEPDMIYKYLRVTYWPDDENTANLREELKNAAVDIDDSYQNQATERSPYLFLFMVVTISMAVIGLWYKKKSHLSRTGRHKKMDLEQ